MKSERKGTVLYKANTKFYALVQTFRKYNPSKLSNNLRNLRFDFDRFWFRSYLCPLFSRIIKSFADWTAPYGIQFSRSIRCNIYFVDLLIGKT